MDYLDPYDQVRLYYKYFSIDFDLAHSGSMFFSLFLLTCTGRMEVKKILDPPVPIHPRSQRKPPSLILLNEVEAEAEEGGLETSQIAEDILLTGTLSFSCCLSFLKPLQSSD